MSKILIVVDMQNDFITGILGTKEAIEIVPNVCKKIKEYSLKDYNIIFTKDTHGSNYLETNEGKHLPIRHCIDGTWGHDIPEQIINQTNNYQIVLKETFGFNKWKRFLKTNFNKIEEIELIGVCTDICVISNALILKSIFTEIPIRVDASCCAGVTPKKHINAIDVMKSCQIEVYND